MRKRLLPGVLFLGCGGAAWAQAPTVTGLVPGRNAVAAPRLAPVRITFSQAIDPATASAVQVNSVRSGGRKAGTYSASGNTLTFAPATAFLPGETVQVTVPAAVQGAGGGAVAPQAYQFTTAVDNFGGGTFAPPGLVPVDNGPSSFVLGDIDGDGDLDMLVAATYSTVSVRLNSGLNSGVFVAPATNASFAVGTAQNNVSLTLGDVDGDSDLDLLVAAGNNPLALRLNSGLNSGVFVTPAVGASITVGSFPGLPVLGDVDGDGDLDVLTANTGANTVSVRLNSGLNSGVFVAPASNAEIAVCPGRTLLGDIDNDGDLDLLALCGTTLGVRLNSGLNSGLFVAPATNADISVGATAHLAALGDVNHDGYVDLILGKAGAAGSIETWLNSGSNTFALFQSMAARWPTGLALGDVDGDGDLDLVVGNDTNANTVSLRLNGGYGSGIFLEPVFTPEPAVGASFPWAVALGDVNGDGNLDLLTSNNNNSGSGTGAGSGTVSVLLNQVSSLRTALAPATGPAGATIMLRGTDVTGASAVSFNGTPVPAGDFSVLSATTLRVVVPVGATAGPVTVTTPRGILTSNTRFLPVNALAASPRRSIPGVVVYPNPAAGPLTVMVPPVAGSATVQLTLLNVLGQAVRQQQAVLPASGTQVQIDRAQLPAGAYLLQLQAGPHLETRRVLLN